MRLVTGFVAFWYDFLVGDAWDIALGVVVALVVMAFVAAASPGTKEMLGPLLAVAVIGLTWGSLRRELRKR